MVVLVLVIVTLFEDQVILPLVKPEPAINVTFPPLETAPFSDRLPVMVEILTSLLAVTVPRFKATLLTSVTVVALLTIS